MSPDRRLFIESTLTIYGDMPANGSTGVFLAAIIRELLAEIDMLQVSMHGESGSWSCPHCGTEYESDDGTHQYADDMADGSFETCTKCNGKYQLRCVAVELEFETRKYKEANNDN